MGGEDAPGEGCVVGVDGASEADRGVDPGWVLALHGFGKAKRVALMMMFVEVVI